MPPDILNKLLWTILRWILLFGVLSILGTAFRILLWPKLKGCLGEAGINFMVRRFMDPSIYRLIPDVMLPTPDGTTQIDHVIVSRYGIFVVETKTYKGWIYGGEREPRWTQVNFRRKDGFQNPLRQNYKHTKTLADLTGIPEVYFKSVVVFSGECEFKTAMPANVVHARDFVRHIEGFQSAIIKDEQVSDVAGAIRQWAGTVSDEQRRRHVRNLRQNHKPVQAEAGSPACPRCGDAMVLRTSRKDGSRFWGCPGYPQGRGTRKAA